MRINQRNRLLTVVQILS